MSGEKDETTGHGAPDSGREPSMEEILASIRRILKDEPGGDRLQSDPAPGDILVLDASMMVKPGIDLAGQTIEPGAPQDPHPEPMPALTATPYTDPGDPEVAREAEKDNLMQDENRQHVHPPEGLVSEATSNATANAIGSLVRSISSERAVAIGRPGLTLEDLVREELRPLLKAWLDTNLPALVERIVRAEIQRVVERSAL